MGLFRRRPRNGRAELERALPGMQERARQAPRGRRKYRNSQAEGPLDVACRLTDFCLLDLFLVVLVLPHLVGVALAGHPEGRVVGAVRVYQRRISARRPACCRFTPTCSAYAVEAVHRHGVLRGGLLAGRRLSRCRPGGRRGDDAVPR